MKYGAKITISEDQECYWLVEYLDILKAQGKILLYTHIPNETFTKYWSVKVRNAKKGVMKGFPDYVIVTNTKTCFIEMKKEKGGTLSPQQKVWIAALKAVGEEAHVCKGFTEAKMIIDDIVAKESL